VSFISGEVSVGTTPTAIVSATGSVLLQNIGAAAVFIGGPGVTISGATEGIELPPAMTSPISVPVGSESTVFGVSGTPAQTVLFWTYGV
jgi:hypothetical protein